VSISDELFVLVRQYKIDMFYSLAKNKKAVCSVACLSRSDTLITSNSHDSEGQAELLIFRLLRQQFPDLVHLVLERLDLVGSVE
jgi:hypothetical protein